MSATENIPWRSLRDHHYPPAGLLVWTAYHGSVTKGRSRVQQGKRTNVAAFEDTEGRHLDAYFWCLLEDSPYGDPPAPSVPGIWCSLFHQEYPNPLSPLWVWHQGVISKGYWWYDPGEMALSESTFHDQHGRPLQASFWREMMYLNEEPPAPPPAEALALVPKGFALGAMPASGVDASEPENLPIADKTWSFIIETLQRK